MLQVDEPTDYVLATGRGYSIKDFLEASFGHVDLDWREFVKFDERYLRPTEVDALIGDSSTAQERLGWTPTVDAPALARIMVDADVEALTCEGRPWIDNVAVPSWELV